MRISRAVTAVMDILIRQSGLRKQREMQWEIGPFPPTARRANLVDPGCDLTKTVRGGSFYPFRGHLSRPACSHVKKLAKQAGDAFDPGRTYRSGRVFHGLMSMRSPIRSQMRSMVRWLAFSQFRVRRSLPTSGRTRW